MMKLAKWCEFPLGLFTLGFLVMSSASIAQEALITHEQDETSVFEWSSQGIPGLKFLRGHEYITYFGVEMANQVVEEKFPPVYFSKIGALSRNFMIKGNVATDFPDKNMTERYGDRGGFFKWQNAPDLQFLHFLRDYPNGQFSTFEEACNKSRNSIIAIAHTALLARENGDYNSYLFWTGHALHALQDSFSQAHTYRNGKQILDICSYGQQDAAICFHGGVLSSGIEKDSIWNRRGKCTINPMKYGYYCLKPEAQLAVKATTGFLITLASGTSGTIESMVFDNLANSTSEFSGYISCK